MLIIMSFDRRIVLGVVLGNIVNHLSIANYFIKLYIVYQKGSEIPKG